MTGTAVLTKAGHRAKAISWAREVLADPNAMVLDLETTGLGPDAEVCDIAIVHVAGHVILDSLVRPEHPIPLAASAVHGITDEMVADAPRWRDVGWHTTVMNWGGRVVVYNAAYDGAIVDRLVVASGFKPVSQTWQCAMKAYADFAGVPGKYPGQFKWHSLTSAARHLGIEVDGAHRALADCLTTLAVIKAMAAADP